MRIISINDGTNLTIQEEGKVMIMIIDDDDKLRMNDGGKRGG